ncbi:MAG: helix-turn-helix domain-containing protein [Deltaproteobacteria bacterium]|nr:helix-turn-helix domain-containing protein [Deltaproteobacteria bacterium]
MANWHPAVAAQSREEKWLRTDQAADRLHLKERRVRQLCENQTLVGIKTGRKWLIAKSSLDEYLAVLNRLNDGG